MILIIHQKWFKKIITRLKNILEWWIEIIMSSNLKENRRKWCMNNKKDKDLENKDFGSSQCPNDKKETSQMKTPSFRKTVMILTLFSRVLIIKDKGLINHSSNHSNRRFSSNLTLSPILRIKSLQTRSSLKMMKVALR